MATQFRQLFSDAQRQQAVADALASRAMQSRVPVQTGRITPAMGIGEGLAQLGEALIARRAGKKATALGNQAEDARRQAQAEALRRLSQQEDPNMVGPPEPFNPFQRAQEALEAGVDPSVVEQFMGQQQKPGTDSRLIGVANPSDFEPESLRKYQETGDPGVLVPRNNTFGRYNPRDYTAESWAKFIETGDPAMLERTAPSQFRPTPGGGLIALDPLNPANTTPVISDEEGTTAAANRARAEAEASASGRTAGEATGAILAKATNAEGIKSLLDLADPLIDVATGSGSGAAADKVAAFFGQSTTGAEAIAQLQVLQAGLILGMPRLEGPQSDRDRQLYIEAAGQIGDPSVPNEIKKAAVSTIRSIQDRYIERAGGQVEPSQPATNLPEGVTEEDLQFTMQKHGLSREEVLRRLSR